MHDAATLGVPVSVGVNLTGSNAAEEAECSIQSIVVRPPVQVLDMYDGVGVVLCQLLAVVAVVIGNVAGGRGRRYRWWGPW